MNSEIFFAWCRVAVKGIKYRPDRDAVHKELYGHLEDRYDFFRSRGWEHEQAIDKTIEAMGDAEELAPQLAKIHRPFWPYMLVISRVTLIIALVITILQFGLFLWEDVEINPSFDDFYLGEFDAYKDTAYQDVGYKSQRVLYIEPGCSGTIDEHKITVTNAAYWRTEYDNQKIEDRFYFRLKVINPKPWLEPALNVTAFFWAEDSLGNYYCSRAESGYGGASFVDGSWKKSGLFTYTFEMYLFNYISQEAEWIDLHYDRDGRDFVLRIALTGETEE